MKAVSLALLVATVIFTLFLSTLSIYNYHLAVDVTGAFTRYSSTFFQFGSYKYLQFNEYQPGAMIFFAALSPSFYFVSFYPNVFVDLLKTVNVALIFIIAFVTYKYTKKYSSLILLSIILLISGPIIYFRFELLVCLFTLLSIYFLKYKRTQISASFISLSILTKLYAIVLVPFQILVINSKKININETLKYVLELVIAAFFVVITYSIFLQAGFSRVLTDLNAHAIKPVHAESFWASIINLYYFLKYQIFITGESANGIYAVKKEYNLFPLYFYNYFWVVTVGALYAVIIATKNYKDIPRVSYTIILAFVLFAKIITPQYLLWFLTIFPLIEVGKSMLAKKLWVTEIALIIVIGILTQYIYPIKYTQLLYSFFTNGSLQYLFWILFTRNILLLLLFIIAVVQVVLSKTARD